MFWFDNCQDVMMIDDEYLNSHTFQNFGQRSEWYADPKLAQSYFDRDLPQTRNARVEHSLG